MKIICIGRNYTKHIEELENEKPDAPVVFLKPDSSVLPKSHPFVIPEFSNDVHYEVEVLVKINRLGKHIQQQFAHKYYNEIGLGIDFTARDLQTELKAKGLPWEKAKGFDGATLIGQHWFDKNDFDLDNLNFELYKNNNLVQQGNTKLMLWKIDELIAYVSRFFTLKIGDIIFTGTPSGVGKVEEGDVLTGHMEDKNVFKVNVR
jgi:2-keto-4-pentenoate hydratase/2-oxohepta-3-ene-1,7-dioic acid hydratase in catechol pathway